MATTDPTNNSPATPATGGSSATSTFIKTDDDMYDSPQELQGDALLPRALRILAEICSPYWAANYQAIVLQDKHRRITWRALVSATLAVCLAIIQLPFLGKLSEREAMILAALEFIAAVLALFYVGWGIIQAVQKHWLLERQKAERFRFLKYRWLLDLVTTTKNDPGLDHWKHLAAREASEILKMDEGDLQQWMKEHRRVARDEKDLHSVISGTDFDAILDFYKRKRLDRQITYHSKKSSDTQTKYSFTKWWPSGLFLLSLGFALFHFAVDILDTGAKFFTGCGIEAVSWLKDHSIVLITAAALLPVLVAAIRTFRSAHEYSRNTFRFEAMYVELSAAATGLTASGDSTTKLKSLWDCEESLENEHRDWLRLMDEAEWYG
jgi:hypothetical protein